MVGQYFSKEIIIVYKHLFVLLMFIFLGTFAVVCLMTGKVVLEHSHPPKANVNTLTNLNESLSSFQVDQQPYTPIQVATTVTFLVAIFQVRIKAHILKTK